MTAVQSRPLRQGADHAAAAPYVEVGELHRRLTGGGEVALLDVREEYDFALGHILLATSLPLSRIELKIRALVPRLATRVVVYDKDGSLGSRAADVLSRLGYSNVHLLAGGVEAWRAAGRPLFRTTHVLAKAFGGVAERAYRTPRITAGDLKERIDAGQDTAIFDARTFAEFQAASLPGAVSCPLAELPARVPGSLRSSETLVVINCASRTRGILGAQSLLNLSLPNPVVVLENGVMAWAIAGGEVVEGASRIATDAREDDVERRRGAARRIARRFGIPLIGPEVLQRFQSDDTRSLYVFDVRSPDAYRAGHLKGARSAPGGQLIMTLQQFAATHMARIVLIDGGDGLTAATTASWLVQVARYQVFVMMLERTPESLEAGDEPSVVAGLTGRAKSIDARRARLLFEARKAVAIDLDDSLAFRDGHIPDAHFAIRSRLPAGLETIGSDRSLVFTSSDGVLAELAAQEVRWRQEVFALHGGTQAWKAAGLPIERGWGRQLHPAEDLWPSPMRETVDRRQAFKDYLDWEVSLADQVASDDTVRFSLRDWS